MLRKILIALSLACLWTAEATAQCCSAGNPYFYSDRTNMEKKELQAMLGYKHSLSDTYYSGSKKIEINDIEKAWFNYLNFQLVYGLTHRLSVQTDLGYFLNKSEAYYRKDWANKTGAGLGDATISLRYLAYKSFTRKYSIIPSLGVKLPVGVFDQEVKNVRLPITIQPSSGSFRYLMSLYVQKAFQNQKWKLGFYGSFEYAQLINSDHFYYKYGNLFLLSLIGSYKVGERMNAGLELRNESRNRALRENEQLVQSSGYNVVSVIPHLSYAAGDKWLWAMNAELPVYRYYNGLQLGNKYAISLSLAYLIGLQGSLPKTLDLNTP